MQHPSISRAGSLAALGLALAYLATAAAAVSMPAALQGRPDVGPHEFWTVLSEHPTAHLAFHWAWIVVGLCGLAVVPALSALVWAAQPGAVLWSGAAAALGFAVMARSHLMEQAFDRRIIAAYPHADPAFQQAVHVVAGLALDVPDGVLTYGAVGAWIVVVSGLALRHRLLPASLASLGLAVAAAHLAGVLGYVFALRPLVVIAVGVGGFVLFPAWYGCLAMVLRRRAAALAGGPP